MQKMRVAMDLQLFFISFYLNYKSTGILKIMLSLWMCMQLLTAQPRDSRKCLFPRISLILLWPEDEGLSLCYGSLIT